MLFTDEAKGQIERAAAKDKGRWNIDSVFYSAEKGHLVATNGQILTVMKVIPEKGEVSGFISKEAFVHFRAVAKKNNWHSRGAGIFAFKDEVVVAGVIGDETRSFQRPSASSFPNYEAIMPKVSQKPTITFNVKLLADLAASLGPEEVVSLWIQDDKTAMVIKTTPNGPIGIIMPSREDRAFVTSLTKLDELYAPKPKKAKKDNVTQMTPAGVQAADEVAQTPEEETPTDVVKTA